MNKIYNINVKIIAMRLIKLILGVFILLTSSVFATEVTTIPAKPVQPPVTVAQKIPYSECTKIFSVDKEKLYFLTLAAVTANKFNIDEIQTSDGYIIFSVSRKQYLATIAKVDNTNSILRITPCDDIYVFPPGVILNMFKYIELNLNS